MKTKIKLYTLGLLLSSVFLTSCDDYLDIIPKGKQLLVKVEDYTNLFNYERNLNYSSEIVDGLSDDRWTNPANVMQYNAGTRSNLFALQFCASNPEVDPRRDFYLLGSTYSGFYLSCYNRISKVSNITLSGIDKVPGDKTLREQTKAEARVLRAYNYFMLINVYAKHYDSATAATDGGVPLVDVFDMSLQPRQASVQEIYDLIQKDIDDAIQSNALSNTPQNAYHFSLAAAYGLKAKVHLFKKEFAEAKAAALESHRLNDYVFNLIDNYIGGDPITKVADLKVTMKSTVYSNDPENLYFALGESFTSRSPSNNIAISPTLAAMYEENGTKDVRYIAFFDTLTTASGAANRDKYYAPAWNVARSGSKYNINMAGMRTTEVILMIAECFAREGNYAEMNKYLDKVRSKRIIGYVPETYTPANKTEAVNIVIKERRKELFFGFHRVFDIRRLNTEAEFRKPTGRTAPANPNIPTIPQKDFYLSPDSYQWIALFPLEELNVNKDLKNNVPY